ncbi:class I SAM-dependent methyltransferase [Halioglobus maricola]|uniref:Class I SAM-dependent methyltransferase n=1 Tax=Halioglobus maricola TaxID=2601894 RepID=A0A5P9NET8_9GAMM|nr:class I SAM-dependent methyltransferase [Halioglobus maricola]QFU74242.1 class I SAM-dependent methyltransferase [Halioglobus maricola]
MDIAPPKHWSQFWQQGHITTFGAALKDNYEGAIKNFWLEQFQTLPPTTELLDVATGNGALALLAAHYADDHQRDWRINACDLAEINRTGDEHPRIELHSGVPCESLPFKNSRFDFVSSQFGFEYSDKAVSLAEIYRTLKPGGRFAAICHHRDSYTLQESRKEMAIYQQGLEKNNIFRAAIAYYQAEAEGAADTAEKQKGVNYAVNRLRQGNAGNPCCDQMVGAISHAIRSAGTRVQQETIAELVSMNDEFTGAYQRLQDLVSAALNAEDMQGLVVLCRNAGFTGVDLGQVFHAPGQLAGFSLIATR